MPAVGSLAVFSMPARHPDWSLRLAQKVEEWRRRPFAYGTVDCLQFVGDLVLAMTGVNYRERFPRYGSGLQALRILRQSGGIEGLLTSQFGPAKPVALARRGDVLVGPFGRQPAAAICLGVHCALPGLVGGLVFPKTLAATATWNV